MALTFVDQTFDTRTVSVVAVGSDWIQESALAEIDKKWLEAALAEDSLSAYTIPNLGITADVYFAPFIKTTAELEATFARARIRSGGSYGSISDNSATVAGLESTVSDHSTTITNISSTLDDHGTTIADQASTLSDLESTVSDHSTTIADNSDSIADNSTNISNNSDAIADLEARIAALEPEPEP